MAQTLRWTVSEARVSGVGPSPILLPFYNPARGGRGAGVRDEVSPGGGWAGGWMLVLT